MSGSPLNDQDALPSGKPDSQRSRTATVTTHSATWRLGTCSGAEGLFGGSSGPAFERMARWGEGYIGASMPPTTIAAAFAKARAAWASAGREGSPRLVAIAYYAIGDIDTGRTNVHDYYSAHGEKLAEATASGVNAGPDAVRSAVQEFAAIGADELIFNPTLDNPDEILRLADAVL
jgi:alkanesulfonate monooxygenase SsuD/methylene tetrahydromethanopterin reductase-like flavin-dependent oxidoreductase (luciferase family)